MRVIIQALLVAVLATSCTQTKEYQVVATTSVVADAARQLLPADVEVTALMSSNIDPHSYKPVERDVHVLQGAQVVLYNGLHLEGKMVEILEKLERQKPVFALGSALAPSKLIEVGPQTYDPHIWFDLALWGECVQGLSQFLQVQFPEHAEVIARNETAYLAQLRKAHEEFISALEHVPAEQRAMVTAHDAFSYFGRAYSIEVRGLQGISTVAEFGVKDLVETAQFILDHGLSTVFTETSVNPKSMEALKEAVEQKGGTLSLGEPLFSDALGTPGTAESTLLGAFAHNAAQVVKSFDK